MQREVLRQSPFVFLKKLIVIELVFALIPILLLVLVDLEQIYEATRFAVLPPFTLLWTLFLMLLQIVAVSAAFVSWYLPRYVLAVDGIYYQRGPGGVLKKIAEYAHIQDVRVEQGALGRRLGYGSVLLTLAQGATHAIRDIDDPGPVAVEIEDRMQQALLHQDITAPAKSVPELLAEGESQYTEFKSSLMWDYRQQRINKKLYTPVMKSLAAFMNSRGGHLLIGVDDEGRILGIEADMQGMRKPNLDGWENTFNLAFNKMIGVEYRRLIDLEFYEVDGKTVCHVYARPANRPIFLKENNEEKFYVRAGNASQPLTLSQTVRYIQARFPTLT
jgi:membrane protein YdbS with pleckstrin-like domain